MSYRDRLPEPLCLQKHHKRRGIVTAGGGPGEGHAAVSVCDKPECIEDAIGWAKAKTGLTPVHRRDGERPHPPPPPPPNEGIQSRPGKWDK